MLLLSFYGVILLMLSTITNRLLEHEKESLQAYVQFKEQSNVFIDVFHRYAEKFNIPLYRGGNHYISDLDIGKPFPHDRSLTSWSKNKDMAIDFAYSSPIPDFLLNPDKYSHGPENFPWDLNEPLVKVLFELDCDAFGLDMNKIYPDNEHLIEDEVIVHSFDYIIKNIEKNDDLYIVKIDKAEVSPCIQN